MPKKWLQHVKETSIKNPGIPLHITIQIEETTFFNKQKKRKKAKKISC